MILLSKNVPLTVNLYETSRRTVPLKKLMPHMSRVRELRLASQEPGRDIRVLFRMLKSGPASLKRIALYCTDPGHPPPVSAPLLLSQANPFPQLRSVTLDRLPFSWNDHIFNANLVSLTIVNQSRHRSAHGEFDASRAVLERIAPTLRSLTLRNAIPPLPAVKSEPPPVAHPYSFNVLRDIVLVGNHGNDCAHLMSHISASTLNSIDVTCSEATGMDILVHRISTQFLGRPLLSLSVRCSDSRVISISAWRHTKVRGTPSMKITLESSSSYSHMTSLLATLLSAAPALCAQVETLKITDSSRSRRERKLFSKLLSLTENVGCLTLNGTGLGFVKDFSLVPHGPSSSADPEAGVPLPRLSMMKLRGVPLVRRSGIRAQEMPIAALLAWIESRSDCGVSKLEKLLLRCCSCAKIAETGLQKLFAAVPVVVIDETESDYSGDEDGDDDDFALCDLATATGSDCSMYSDREH